MEAKKNYKDTLNLPQTTFAMEAKLTVNEPARLKRWHDIHLYDKLLESRASDPKWILHDGPPFANGDIHIGHVINKTLKDVVLRFHSLQGYQTPYVPGWDCHGLPIEHKIQQDVGPRLRQMNVVDVRKLCYEYAEKYAKIQSEQFQRLGILGEWNNPYWTMTKDYEAATLEVFARFVDQGLVYKKLKPVAWSIENQTALADAELEYKDVADQSVYVEFRMVHMTMQNAYFIVWTTTPWTLPANLAIAVNPEVKYAKVRYRRNREERFGFVAADLVERVFKGREGIESYEVVDTEKGSEFVGDEYFHPFVKDKHGDPRTGRVIATDYVTTTDGTGLVHTAPGHGEEDYEAAIREKIEIYSPVQANGRFDDTVPEWIRGKSVWEGNTLVTDHLKNLGVLFAEEKITHSYPHDWRSKKPIIFRATEQWFINVDCGYSPSGDKKESLRARALHAVNGNIDFVPKWGQARFCGMLESRPDWCVSRQRAWGLPIPVFYNEKGDALLTGDSVRAVAKRFAQKGSDTWFTESPAELLGDYDPGPNFPREKLRKEKDIFDVWFESGSSWHAVLQSRSNLHFPADLYLEGSDQHRGWFQLSLLPSLGATGKAPFKQVLTHGFVVKPDGTKVSKSDKEYVTATQEINKHGADLLRLWCCSVDYQNDIPASPAAIQEFGDKYRKIRNTLRYLLSNLYDFDPNNNAVGDDLRGLDGWALGELQQLIADVTDAYKIYQLHRAFRLLHDFCAVQISAVYGNAMKDRLYCEVPDSHLRRRCQSVMYRMADALVRLLSPMLVFTADEAWEHLPHKLHRDSHAQSVHLLRLPELTITPTDDDRRRWKLLLDARDQATMQLDALKKSVGLNKALDAEIIYHCDDQTRKLLEPLGADLEDVAGAGNHSFVKGEWKIEVLDARQKYQACARSWKRRPDVGSDPAYPDLSARDAAAVHAISKT